MALKDFDPYLHFEVCTPNAAKPAKVAKDNPSLASLATLAPNVIIFPIHRISKNKDKLL